MAGRTSVYFRKDQGKIWLHGSPQSNSDLDIGLDPYSIGGKDVRVTTNNGETIDAIEIPVFSDTDPEYGQYYVLADFDIPESKSYTLDAGFKSQGYQDKTKLDGYDYKTHPSYQDYKTRFENYEKNSLDYGARHWKITETADSEIVLDTRAYRYVVNSLTRKYTFKHQDVYMYHSSAKYILREDIKLIQTPDEYSDNVEDAVDISSYTRTTNGSEYQTNSEMLDSMSNLFKSSGVIENSRIFGMPYSFIPATDFPAYNTSNAATNIENLGLGREFIENIVAEAPIVYISPGIPSFMPDASADDKIAFDSYLKSAQSEENAIMNATERDSYDGRYYDFIPAYAEYIKYVNLLCRASAIYMGIGDMIVPGSVKIPYKNYNWSNYTNIKWESAKVHDSQQTFIGQIFEGIAEIYTSTVDSVATNIFGDDHFIKCYVDPSSSMDESFSNSTRESMVKSLFDSAQDIVKEINFFAKEGSLINKVGGVFNDVTTTLSSGLASIDSNLNIGLADIISSATQIVGGANLLFPELWSDSDYSKEHSFTMTLTSPYGDAQSIYLNIIAPMMHIIALTVPRQVTANSFASPFLVRSFCKGRCSTDLGIISSLSISKGGNGDAWTPSGLPTEVKLSFSIKDLYTNLMITKSTRPWAFFENNGLIDFLAVTCGVNITEPNFTLKLYTLEALYKNLLFDVPENLSNSIIERVRNWVRPFFTLTGWY